MPSQDMVLGCYYLTTNNPASTIGEGQYFASLQDVLMAYEQKQISLHALIWVRFEGRVDNSHKQQLVKEMIHADSSKTSIYSNTIIKYDQNGQYIAQYIRTTPGRILFHKVVKESLID